MQLHTLLGQISQPGCDIWHILAEVGILKNRNRVAVSGLFTLLSTFSGRGSMIVLMEEYQIALLADTGGQQPIRLRKEHITCIRT